MIPRELNAPSKALVTIAALCVAAIWAFVALVWLTILTLVIMAMFGWLPWRPHLGLTALRTILSFFALVVLCGGTWLTIAFNVRCSHCDFKFLKNPKGLGPANFIYHPNCQGNGKINGWTLQVYRFLTTGKMRCVKCGQELFEQISSDTRDTQDSSSK
jgi:DNA-directed RNA polymerase subunit RPC12/RpoP